MLSSQNNDIFNDPATRIRFNEACASILSSFDKFRTKLGFTNMVIDPKLVENVVKSWLHDENRHIQFHPITILENYKPMAYFMHWFTRIKPIRCKTMCISDKQSVVNETFAFMYTCERLKIGQRKMSSPFVEKFIYMLYYRNIHSEPLFMTLYLLKNSTRNLPANELL